MVVKLESGLWETGLLQFHEFSRAFLYAVRCYITNLANFYEMNNTF